jgi:hypothetical protein
VLLEFLDWIELTPRKRRLREREREERNAEEARPHRPAPK